MRAPCAGCRTCARWTRVSELKGVFRLLPVLAVAFASETMAQDGGAQLFSLTPDAVEALATETGWSIGPRIETDEGGYSQTFTTAGGLPIQFDGWSCQSDDLDGCSEYQLTLTFGVGSPERAQALRDSLSYGWANTSLLTEEAVIISRAEFLYGGVGRDHLKQTFAAFGEIAQDAAGKVFPCGLPVDGMEPSC